MLPAGEDTFQSELVALIPRLRAYAQTLCRNSSDADDLTQAALSKAWACRAQFQDGTNLKAWAFTILRNTFFNSRKKAARMMSLAPGLAERIPSAPTNPTARLELNELRQALDRLPDHQRDALILVAAAGLTYEEAADICGVAVGTVKSRVGRARLALATVFSEVRLAGRIEDPGLAMAMIFAEADVARLRPLPVKIS